MVRVELGENLAAGNGGDRLSAVAFSLIEWAQRTGHSEELIVGARRGNPGNPALQALAAAPAPVLRRQRLPSFCAARRRNCGAC